MRWKRFRTAYLLTMIITGSLSPVSSANRFPVPVLKTHPADQAISAYEKGYDYYRKGLFKKAEDYLTEAIKHEPNLIKAHYWLGKLYRETGQLESAIYHWEEVERLNDLIRDRRIALSVKNNEYPARAQTLRAVKLRNDARKLFEKGIYLLDRGHWDGAEVELREAVRLYPANHKYLITLARMLWDKEEKAASIKFYRDLLSLRDVSYEDFREGVDRMLAADMDYVAAPLIHEQKNRFMTNPGFNELCQRFSSERIPDIVSAGRIVQKLNGQVVINIGFNDGIGLSDEYSLNLRSFKPGKPIFDPDSGKMIGRTADEPTADLMVTKVNRDSSWALIKKEMGSGVKAGDLIEIKKAIR
ncbi:MAG: hypothetical protein PWR01_2312 [Clostridiales bacterium]|jgi:tetratricopeptide (TPR) repeat protein|nr:hypothetical protein [Clostridiales bacterium]MDN5281239.1 hypothetical protein [Candidatus Ozemobacter sp.]